MPNESHCTAPQSRARCNFLHTIKHFLTSTMKTTLLKTKSTLKESVITAHSRTQQTSSSPGPNNYRITFKHPHKCSHIKGSFTLLPPANPHSNYRETEHIISNTAWISSTESLGWFNTLYIVKSSHFPARSVAVSCKHQAYVISFLCLCLFIKIPL